MKKFLAILMTVAMVVCAFTFSVSADRVVGGSNGDIDDGVTTFTDTPISGNVVLQLSGIESRYAVDVVFGTLTFNFGDVSKWNVNTMEYETTASANPNVLVTIEVYNYSDNAVYTKVVPTFETALAADAELMALIFWNSSAADGKGTIEDHTYYGIVPSATTTSPNPAWDRSRVELSLVDPNGSWQNVANALRDYIDPTTQTITLGSITVTVSMNSLRP